MDLSQSLENREKALLCIYKSDQQHTWLKTIFRCLIGLDPSSGTNTTKMVSQKSGKVQERKRNGINPHVSSLLKRLMDFEWPHLSKSDSNGS
ncbi:hypothetical protein DPEC_G00096540 [Dallia pectoralis]|uniref:Uncharacterized protein n=1 Tax=Dallia pectoralis TaxID=75939 RepID=A0ACC2GVL0_DALPE|nr:hypothetical protein DPEC_G00096540 [Dallia pectoralis]